MSKAHLTESQIQSLLIKRLEASGWYVIKLAKTNKNGISDLLSIKPSRPVFIEAKRPGQKLSALQQFRMAELQSHGIETIIAYSLDDIDILC